MIEVEAAPQITPMKNGAKVFTANNQSLPPRKSHRLENQVQSLDKITKFQPSPEDNNFKNEKNSLVSYWNELNPR